MYKYRFDQHLIVLNLYVSINKSLVTGFMTMTVSQNLNSREKIVKIVESST